MKKILLTLICSLFTFLNISNAKELNLELLDKKDESIIEISALTTIGDTKKLEIALNKGLNYGLTKNEIKEILVQTYAYAGFPRSLGGIGTFMKVVEERTNKGIKDEIGKEASPIPNDLNKDEYGAKVRAALAGQDTIPNPSGYQLFSPIIDTFLKEHLFADIFARDILTHKQRELSTISVLATLGNVHGPLKFHLQASINTGWTKEQLKEFVKVIENSLDEQKALEVESVLKLI
ncbi:carboxymuconolactone decarboxylase family protein [Arcobacter lacus]|uniref:Carboxymuconolactone decarboxylase n=1 Tax=Arcobacter lacus TaxID=1912876 RepID=A0ABX5JK87_9BACT|nr:carboxymuconolactone decarboxylase family protein [Arcobacter lacus]PUE64853.1 carboxymuconolactone decarboxylase [Arcobacter lacus]